MHSRVSRGHAGEMMAVDYLIKKGYRILRRNYRFQHGEIDIVARDGEVLVFIEVKSFRSRKFGAPEEAVSVYKRERLRKTASGYLFENGIDDEACRFDVIAIDLKKSFPCIRHIREAF